MEYGALVASQGQRKTEAFGEILVPLPLHPPKIPHIGIWHWIGPPRREANV